MRSARNPSAAASKRNGRAPGPRDQDASTFSAILERLVRSVVGAQAAALVDAEGETVDYAGDVEPFDIKVAAAHWRVVLSEIAECFGGIRQIVTHARRKSYVVRQIHTEYMIVLVLHRRAGFAASERALQEAHVRLCSGGRVPAAAEHEPVVRGRGRGRAAKDCCRPAKLRVAADVAARRSHGLRHGPRGPRKRLPRAPAERRRNVADSRALGPLVRRRTRAPKTEGRRPRRVLRTEKSISKRERNGPVASPASNSPGFSAQIAFLKQGRLFLVD